MESIACDFCKGTVFRLLWSPPDRLSPKRERFHVVRCTKCDLVFVQPRPTRQEILKYYPENYTPYHPSGWFRWQVQKWFLRREVHLLRSIFGYQQVRIVEVGSGAGEDLRYLRDEGKFAVEGTDISPHAAAWGKKEFGLDISVGELEALGLPPASYDVVRMKYVASHVHSPRKLLAEAFRLLAPGGYLLVWAPNFNSLGRRIFRSFWQGGEPPRHLYDFSAATLTRYLEEVGFQKVEVRHGIAPNTFVHSLRMVLYERPLLRPLSYLFTLNPLALLLFSPISLFAALIRQSDRIMMIAKKS